MPESAFKRVPEGLASEYDSETDEYLLIRAASGQKSRGAPRELRELDTHRQAQAAQGIDISLVDPWIDLIKAAEEPDLQQAWCRVLNEESARSVQGVGHTYFLAALPDSDGARAAEELHRAASMGAVGGMLPASPEGGTFEHHGFDVLWATAVRLDMPIVLHPGSFEPPARLRQFFLNNLAGNPFETTVAVGLLVGARVPDRFPALRLVLVHGGGFFPYQYGRMDAGFARTQNSEGGRALVPSDYLQWFFYDTVLFEGGPIRYLIDLVGVDHVMAGSDCPFVMKDHRAFAEPSILGLDVEGTAKVVGGNAQKFLVLHD